MKHRALSVLEVRAHLAPETAPDKVFSAGERWTGDGRGTWWQLTVENSETPQCNTRVCGCHVGCTQEPPPLVNVEVVGSLREFRGHGGPAEGRGVGGTVTLAVWRRKQSQRWCEQGGPQWLNVNVNVNMHLRMCIIILYNCMGIKANTLILHAKTLYFT